MQTAADFRIQTLAEREKRLSYKPASWGLGIRENKGVFNCTGQMLCHEGDLGLAVINT